MSRKQSYVYVSKNRVERPVFRGSMSSMDMSSSRRWSQDSSRQASPFPSSSVATPIPTPTPTPPPPPPVNIIALLQQSSSDSPPPAQPVLTVPPSKSFLIAPPASSQAPHTPPPPNPSPALPPPPIILFPSSPSPPPLPPEINTDFYSSADCYSHGRLPLVPPWVKISSAAPPHNNPRTNATTNGMRTKSPDVYATPPLKGVMAPMMPVPSSPASTQSGPESFGSSVSTLPPRKRRNTLKKRAKQTFTFHVKSNSLS